MQPVGELDGDAQALALMPEVGVDEVVSALGVGNGRDTVAVGSVGERPGARRDVYTGQPGSERGLPIRARGSRRS